MQNFLLLTLVGLSGFFTPLFNRLDSGPENKNNSSPRNTTSTERWKTTEHIPASSIKTNRCSGLNLGKNSDCKSSSHHSTTTKIITRPPAAPHHTNGGNKPESWYGFAKKHREKLHRGWKELKNKFRLNKVDNSSHDSNKRKEFNVKENTQKSAHEIRDKSVQDRTASGIHQTRLDSAHTTEAIKHKQAPNQTWSIHQAFHYSTAYKRRINLTAHGFRGEAQYKSSINFSLFHGRRGATVYQNKTNLTTHTTHSTTHAAREGLRAEQSSSRKTCDGSAHTTDVTKHEQTHIQTLSTHQPFNYSMAHELKEKSVQNRKVGDTHQTRSDSAHTTEATMHQQPHNQTSSTHQAFNYSVAYKAQYEGEKNFSARHGRRGATVYHNRLNLTAPTTHPTTHVTREGLRTEPSTSTKTDEVHRTSHVTPTDEGFERKHTDTQSKQTEVDHSTARLHNNTNEDKDQITNRGPELDKQTLHHKTEKAAKVESAEMLRAKEEYSQAKKELDNLISEKENNSLWTQGRYSELLKFQRLINEKRLEVQQKQTEWERLCNE